MVSNAKTVLIRPGKDLLRDAPPFNLGISGGGPRATQLIIGMVINYVANIETISKIAAANVPIRITVFEQQPKAFGATGMSIPLDCDAALNTAVWGPVHVDNVDQIPEEYKETLLHLNNLAATVAEKAQSNPEYADVLAKTNLGTFAMFKQAMNKSCGFDTSSACADRGFIGRVHREMFFALLDFVDENVPGIKINTLYEHMVVDTDFTDRLHPALLVEKCGSAKRSCHVFDFVILANGTTCTNPLKEAVRPMAFSDTPNRVAIKKYLKGQGILDTAGKIKPKTRIGITGMSLSAYDNVPLILQDTDLFSRTENGYVINESKVADYQGLLTFISRSDKAAPPRLVSSGCWPGEVFLFDTNHVHAARLQNGFDWLGLFHPMLIYATAYELGIHPSEVEVDKPVVEKMKDFARQTKIYTETGDGRLEWGFLRAGYQALLDGFGLEKDLAFADRIMSARAPYSWAGRSGWLMRRSAAYEPTRPEVAKAHSNMSFFDVWENQLQLTVAASPTQIQDMVSQLFEHGVARHEKGSFAELGPREGVKTGLHDQTFDALFAPMVLTPKADKVLASLKGKVKEVIPGLPDYTKGRFLQTCDGKLINAIDVGTSGLGAEIESEDGGKSVVSMLWSDTNTHASAVNWAGYGSKMILFLASIQSSGLSDAVDVMMKNHFASLPTTETFDAEIMQFASDWHEIHERKLFLDICATLAKTGENFKALASHAWTVGGRNRAISGCGDLKAQQAYRERIAAIPSFNPVGRDAYSKRFLDFTHTELDDIYRKQVDVIENSKRSLDFMHTELDDIYKKPVGFIQNSFIY